MIRVLILFNQRKLPIQNALLCLFLVPVLESTKIDSRSKAVGLKNRQLKQVFLSLERELTRIIDIWPIVTVSLPGYGFRLE